MGTQSEQLERKAQQARARLTETLKELRAGLTPGQVVDQLAGYAREGPAAEFFRNLARQIWENPLPLTLSEAQATPEMSPPTAPTPVDLDLGSEAKPARRRSRAASKSADLTSEAAAAPSPARS